MTIFTDKTTEDGVVLALIYALLVIGATLVWDRYSGHEDPGYPLRRRDG